MRTLLALLLVSCANYDFTLVGTPAVVSISETTPSLGSEQEPLFEVKTPILLPMRAPTAEEARSLTPLAPYPRTPFVVSTDTRVTARYVLSNLDDEDHTIEFLLDPWNEFVRYDPGPPVVNEEEILVNLSGIDRFVKIPAKGRVVGIVTPDDFLELAKDLGTVQALAQAPMTAAGDAFAGPTLYNRAFNVQNREGETDPLLRAYVPKVAASVIGFDIGMRARARMRVSLDVTYEVTDLNGERVVRPDEPKAALPRPATVITPPPPPVQ